ncbi:MAG: pyrroline-5-carboxylate reductase [Gammaproteobacteria bacterium]
MPHSLLAFVGGGHMASAIIGGMIKAGHPPQRIVVAGRSAESLQRLKSLYDVGTVIGADNIPAAATAVVLAVRPADAKAVCGRITINAPLISVVAGLTLAQMKQCAPNACAHIRAMPNTPAQVGKGMTALCAPQADAKTRQTADDIFAAVGKTLWLKDEKMMAAATAISGSGPGYVFYFAEALEDAARQMGFDEAEARMLVLQTISGAATLAEQSGKTPQTLRENIAVPGGTTERAITLMREQGFAKIIRAATKASARRARELSD